MSTSTVSGANVVATVEGCLVQFAVVSVPYPCSSQAAFAKALDRLDRFCDIRDLVAPAVSYSATPRHDGGWDVNIVCG
jgi:hypothetical protein